MAVNLVRANSDTPNIQNYDDARILRFAVGGNNGVLSGYKNQCSYTTGSALFTINTGEIVIDGWQVEIDGLGYGIALENSSTALYYSIFAAVDLRTSNAQVGKIEAVYDTTLYEHDKPQEDLSDNPFGQHYLLLYTFKVLNGTISEVVRKFDYIKYNKDIINELETRLGNRINNIGATSVNPVNYARNAQNADTATNVEKTGFSGDIGIVTSGITTFNETGYYLINILYTVYSRTYSMVGFVYHLTSREGLLNLFIDASNSNYVQVRVSTDGVVSYSIIGDISSVIVQYRKMY